MLQQRWKVDTTYKLYMSIVLTFLFSFCSIFYSKYRTQLKVNEYRLGRYLLFLTNYLIKLTSMFLSMSMSLQINLAIISGSTFGCIITQNHKPKMQVKIVSEEENQKLRGQIDEPN